MLQMNDFILHHRPFRLPDSAGLRLEERHPQLFPTNVRPETLQQDAKLRQRAADGRLPKAEFLRFTSPVRTPYPETTASTPAGFRLPWRRWQASRNRR